MQEDIKAYIIFFCAEQTKFILSCCGNIKAQLDYFLCVLLQALTTVKDYKLMMSKLALVYHWILNFHSSVCGQLPDVNLENLRLHEKLLNEAYDSKTILTA